MQATIYHDKPFVPDGHATPAKWNVLGKKFSQTRKLFDVKQYLWVIWDNPALGEKNILKYKNIKYNNFKINN